MACSGLQAFLHILSVREIFHNSSKDKGDLQLYTGAKKQEQITSKK